MSIAPLPHLLAKCGLRPVDLARAVSVHKSTVTRWAESGVPATRVLDVERVTGISRHHLRPDIYGPAPTDSQEAA